MINLQEKVEQLLMTYAEAWSQGLQIIASHRYSNIGTYHILDVKDNHIRSVEFSFQENRVEFAERPFNIPEDWDELRKYLKELVKGYGDFAPASLRYDRLTPVEIAEFVKELVDSDWWTEEIYAKLSDEIQERLKRMGRLSPWIPRTYTLACTLASDEILGYAFEQYLYGELDLRVMQKEAEEKAEAIADKE